jgi:juvenile hormone epoxide hydrolase
MKSCTRFTLLAATLLTAFLYQKYTQISKPLTAPKPDIAKYWGPGNPKSHKDNTSIKPFTVTAGTDVIAKLRSRLNDEPRYVAPLEGVAFEYGFNTKALQDMVKYWRTTYLDKWNEREKYLNKFSQFQTMIQG